MSPIPIAPEVPLKRPRTMAEAAFYNQGIDDLLQLAQRAAERIEAIGARPVHEAFAVAALTELADTARALMIWPDNFSEEDTARLPKGPLPTLPADAAEPVPA